MNNTRNFEKRVGQVSILAGILALASIYFTAAGSAFNTDVFNDPLLLPGATNVDVQLLKWSMILDMFGYYLLLLPALFFFQHYLQKRTAWSYLLSWCGSAYIFIGAIGAAILAVVLPDYVTEYPIATAAQQEIIMRNFRLVNQMVYGSMWNTLEVVLAGAWWLGIGLVVRKEQPAFGIVTIILGAASLLDGFGNMAGIAAVAETGLGIYLILGIVWPVWFGIRQWRGAGGKQSIRPASPAAFESMPKLEFAG